MQQLTIAKLDTRHYFPRMDTRIELCKVVLKNQVIRSLLADHYNMVCSALFLQRALYTVHCTNIMHSRKPSFVITPAVFS